MKCNEDQAKKWVFGDIQRMFDSPCPIDYESLQNWPISCIVALWHGIKEAWRNIQKSKEDEKIKQHKKFEEKYKERMKKPIILSRACPNCGREWGWLNLQPSIEETRKEGESNIPKLGLFDFRWICLNCLHIWVDSECEEVQSFKGSVKK